MAISKDDLFNTLPPEWNADVLPQIEAEVHADSRKVVVLDDDPTGTQTVHGVPVVTDWSTEMLSSVFQHPDSLFYVLTNSRSLSPDAAEALNAEIAMNLLRAKEATGRDFVLISRSDSTLRGHYPLEINTLITALGTDVDGVLLVPAFFAGGRYTINDVHYVQEGDTLIPAAETPFAKDATFGYRSSNLREWVEEKVGTPFDNGHIVSLSLSMIRTGGPDAVYEQLLKLKDRTVCIVNAASRRDLDVVALGALRAEQAGKRLIYRTAATFAAARGGIAPRPLLARADLSLGDRHGGLVVVGSYVPKSTQQLDALLNANIATPIELRAASCLADDTLGQEVERCTNALNQALTEGDVVLYTSRDLITGADAVASLAIGRRIAEALIAVLKGLRVRPRYLVAKGGITSSDVATRVLNVKQATVAGQILPGVPVWTLGDEALYPGLSYVVFPGNVGDAGAVLRVVEMLRGDA